MDPEQYFIIVPNLLGNGLSSSPSNTPPPYDRANFPQVTIYDNVLLQHRLVTEQFGIRKIELVLGWSMGGIQAYQWGATFPDMVESIAPFAGIAKTWPHTHVVLDGMKSALLASVGFDLNKLDQLTSADMRAVGRVYAGWGLSQEFYRQERYSDLGCASLAEVTARVWEDSFTKMDPHNVLAMLWTGQHADISANPIYNGDFERALSSIQAQACIMPGSMDLFCSAVDNEYEASCMPHATLRPIRSIWGHFAGRGINHADNEFIDENLKQLLAS